MARTSCISWHAAGNWLHYSLYQGVMMARASAPTGAADCARHSGNVRHCAPVSPTRGTRPSSDIRFIMLPVVARRLVWAVAATATLYGVSAGPCRHRDAPTTVEHAADAASTRGAIDAGHHGHASSAQDAQSATHHAPSPDGDTASGCHCLGACCCTPPAGLVVARGMRVTLDAVRPVAPAAPPTGFTPARAERLLPPATAPPALLVAA